VRSELDTVDSVLAPRTGRLDAGLFAKGDFDDWRAGGYIEATARPTGRLSAFLRGEAGYDSEGRSSFWAALGGLRLRF
jgi:hypothetical protein